MADEDISKLLQQAEQLMIEIKGDEEIPGVERSLEQVLEGPHDLSSRVNPSGLNYKQAEIFFGTIGIDLLRMTQIVDNLYWRIFIPPINAKENGFPSFVKENRKCTFKTIQQKMWDYIKSESKKKQTKENNATIDPTQHWLDMQQNLPPSTDRMLDSIEVAYARQVQQYVQQCVQHASHESTPLHQMFTKVAEESHDPIVKEMWEVIKTLANIPGPIADEDPLKARGSLITQQALIARGKEYLEKRFKEYMTVVAPPFEALRGGEPGTLPLVLAFLRNFKRQNIRGFADGVIDDIPIWPTVYYCLRCGDADAALYCLRKTGVDNELIAAIEDNISVRGKALYAIFHLKLKYRLEVRYSIDPFKRAVYCAVGGCDDSDDHPKVLLTAGDYLWLKFSIMTYRTDNDAVLFTHLQKMVLEKYDETHHKAQENPLVYFQMLTLTGQFELAIEYLLRFQRYRVHGIHMAIALHELNMLGVQCNGKCPLLSVDADDPVPYRRFNLIRLILIYIGKFEVSRFPDALNYYFLLRNIKDAISGQNAFTVCCSDFAAATGKHELLFGRLDPVTGLCGPGLLDQFKPRFNIKDFAVHAGGALVSKGVYEEAIIVYDIAGNLVKVVELFCVLLSQILMVPDELQEMRTRVLTHADQMMCRLRAPEASLPPPLLNAFTKLRKLCTFFDHFEDCQYQTAMKTLRACKLVPLSPSEVDARLADARCARVDLLRALPPVLFALCRMLVVQRLMLQTAQCSLSVLAPTNKTVKQAMDDDLLWLQQTVGLLVSFATTISYKLPEEIYMRLAATLIIIY